MVKFNNSLGIFLTVKMVGFANMLTQQNITVNLSRFFSFHMCNLSKYKLMWSGQ